MIQSAVTHPKTSDIECLRCGAMNIPENHVCGRCGASLPLIYDEEGNVFSWRGHSLWDEALHKGAQRRSYSRGWTLRIGVILFALFLALWVLRHH